VPKFMVSGGVNGCSQAQAVAAAPLRVGRLVAAGARERERGGVPDHLIKHPAAGGREEHLDIIKHHIGLRHGERASPQRQIL
jgi:hypothetical protein